MSVSATLLGLVAGEGASIPVADFHIVFLMLPGFSLLAVAGLLAQTPQDGILVSNHVRNPGRHPDRCSASPPTGRPG